MKYKILNAYRNKDSDNINRITAIMGLVAMAIASFADNTPLGILGGTVTGLGVTLATIEYGKAYMEARLDYIENNKFTKLEEKVEEL